MMNNKKQRYGFGFVRVSTDKQEELSPDSQEKLIRDYAKNNNIVLLKIFFEIGVSGRHAEKRQTFQEMIAAAKAPDHPVDVIVVWKFSRFARNQEESIVYKSLLKKQHNVDVVSVSEPLVDGPFGSLIERIIEWMDEYYSIRLSDEVLRGMKEKAVQEGYQMVPPLGYRAVGGGRPFEINEEEFQITQYIFDRYDIHHDTPFRIAQALNDMGYKTRRGNRFELRTIKRILENPFYYGLVVWNDISFVGQHEVRLTKERYDARMEYIQSQYRPHKRRDIASCNHWLSGLLKCGVCGHTLTFTGHNRKAPGFQCYRYSKGLHPESHYISEPKVIAAVYEYFEKLLDGMDFEYAYRPQKSDDTLSLQKSVEDEIEKLASREARIRLAFENGVDTLEEYAENKKRLKIERERLERQLVDIHNVPDKEAPSKDTVLDRVRTVYDVIRNPDIDDDTKGSFMRSLVEDIVFDKKNGLLIFHLYVS